MLSYCDLSIRSLFEAYASQPAAPIGYVQSVTKPALVLRGSKTSDDGSVNEVICAIYPPNSEEGQQNWSCLVRCPFLFDADKRIAGADAAQAIELAETFLRDLLRHHGVRLDGET